MTKKELGKRIDAGVSGAIKAMEKERIVGILKEKAKELELEELDHTESYETIQQVINKIEDGNGRNKS